VRESVIKGFRHRGLQRLYERDDPRGIRPDLLGKVQNVLSILDAAASPRSLDLPGYRIHPLKGARAGFWAVTVRANWRIIFTFRDGDAYDVELIDYH
jgi:toxin HigB-1